MPIAAAVKLTVRATILVAVLLAASFAVWAIQPRQHVENGNPPPPGTQPPPCPNSVGLCVERTVTRVLDGDTVEVDGGLRIRLVLVDAPETYEAGGSEATAYLTDLCLGKRALIDEDDGQVGGDAYGRTLAAVHCGGTNANADLISSGRAGTYFQYCSVSEFGDDAWSGCSSPPPPGNCDPAYPDVCIPPPPPDLDCGGISYRNFRVLSPDPHHFDGDGDGTGCEA